MSIAVRPAAARLHFSPKDHLCPWTGTGIGGGNMLAFKAFVVAVNILCYFSIILLVWSLLDGLAA